MRLATLPIDGALRCVASTDGKSAHDITEITAGDLTRVLSGTGRDALRQRKIEDLPLVDLDDVRWLPPVPRPERILCVGLNYASHASEIARDATAQPTLFSRFPSSFVGHGTPVERPRVSDTLDWEGEIAFVISDGRRDIAAADALDHVAGYTLMAENSVRGYQEHSRQATAGKNFDRSGSWGPWIITADEVPDPAALELRTYLNGKLKQKASLAELVFSIQTIIEYVSSFTQLVPGDVIATGTPAGIGLRETPPRFLRPGDELVVEIPGLLTLANSVCDQP
jgi:2-keto-4-pentenoate hydratase/2-oxohepta-3-ene-1,7-dioic acid hydratase in catechol pathway